MGEEHDLSIILLSDKIKSIFKEYKDYKILEILKDYNIIDILSMPAYKLHRIKNEYVKKEKERLNIHKYCTFCKEFYMIKGYSEEEAELKIQNRKNKLTSSPYKVDTYINKGYSEDDAIFLVNSKRPVNKEYWINKGYSEEEAIQKVKEFQSNSSKKYRTQYKKDPIKYLGVNTTQKEYWINKGYSEEEAIQKVKERQTTFTLEKCISKYGIEIGKARYDERQEKWKNSLQKNFDIYGDGRSPQSLWATNCINKICSYFNIDKPNKEKYITDKDTKKHYSYDFCYNHKIIEFNGDYWHCNPLFWKENAYNSSIHVTAKEKWEIDKQKIECAKSYGYNVFVLWENEYNEDPDGCIKKCINFIKDED